MGKNHDGRSNSQYNTEVRNKVNIIEVENTDKILKSLRDIITDLDSMELFFAKVELDPLQVNRIKQFSANTKTRVKNVVWRISAEKIYDDPRIKNS